MWSDFSRNCNPWASAKLNSCKVWPIRNGGSTVFPVWSLAYSLSAASAMPTCSRRKKIRRSAPLDAHILMTEAKHFKNLHLQESRLRRQYKQDAQELRELQERRKEQEEAEAHTQPAKIAAKPKELVAQAAASGFEFTNTVEPGQKEKAVAERKHSDVVLSGTASV